MRDMAGIRSICLLFALSIAADIDASCLSRESRSRLHGDEPQFILLACNSAEEYLAQDQRFLQILAEDNSFASQMERRGFDTTDLAIKVSPVNQAAASYMLGKDESTWFYKGHCENVPLDTPVFLRLEQACSDTGYTFISFFSDVSIQEILGSR